MRAGRYLIVNADDFGQSPGVNRGIIRAHEEGIVTSASLMVRWPAAVDAGAYSRSHPELSVGLHADLGEWVYKNDAWVRVYEVVPTDNHTEVASEIARQLAAFRGLIGRDPSHLDSHQHVHRSEPVRSILLEASQRLGIPLRDVTPGIRYRGDFYGQTARGESLPEAISVEALTAILRTLPPGVTELGCHSGEGDDLDSTYGSERTEEVRVLCDPRIRATLAAERIKLRSFTNFTDVR